MDTLGFNLMEDVYARPNASSAWNTKEMAYIMDYSSSSPDGKPFMIQYESKGTPDFVKSVDLRLGLGVEVYCKMTTQPRANGGAKPFWLKGEIAGVNSDGNYKLKILEKVTPKIQEKLTDQMGYGLTPIDKYQIVNSVSAKDVERVQKLLDPVQKPKLDSGQARTLKDDLKEFARGPFAPVELKPAIRVRAYKGCCWAAGAVKEGAKETVIVRVQA
jgi:hypothetical protein